MNSVVTVRLARPHEASALADLAARTFPLANPPGADPENIAAFIADNLTTEHFEKYLANPNARIVVGCIPFSDDPQASSAPDSNAVVQHEGVREQLMGYSLIFGGADGLPEDSYSVRHNPSVYLSKFYVDPLSRGGVVSTPLMREVREVARLQLGGRSLWLAVNQLNERAGHFYEKSGFERVGTKRMQVGEQSFADFVYEASL